MIQYHIYPGGKKRILTFSYDDGADNDIRLVELFNKYNLKASFHLNGKNHREIDENEKNRLRKLYAGHEISCHTLSHGWPSRMPAASLVTETMEDRKILEDIARYPVIGMSYPSGSYNDEVIKTLASCGIVYSRTTKSTNNFNLPENFLEWHPSCHHRDALELADKFLNTLDSEWYKPLLYIWGHSHELNSESDWAMMEELCKKLANNDKIWYATNIDIYNYFTAQKQLQISADETMFYNPTDIDVWVEKNRRDIIKIRAGEKVSL